ncbi:MAG TPA: hypothetical protein ENO22_04760 [candidate division Zixibacteria bacterium]|nr:hypothetical protein [candidate division Zixibacteria bacterium]
MKTRMIIVIAIGLISLLINPAGAELMPAVSVDLGNEPDAVDFINDNLLLCTDIDGLVKITAKLEAFSLPGCERLWFNEYPIGSQADITGIKDLPYHLWADEDAGLLFVGNGPLNAVDCKTGELLWSVDYDQTGMVYDVTPCGDYLFAMGTKTRSKFTITFSQDYGSALDHIKDPILYCLDKKDGTIKWKYEYDPPRRATKKKHRGYYIEEKISQPFPGLYLPEGMLQENSNVEQGGIYILGKYVYCLDPSDGSEVWVYKNEPSGEIAFSDKYLYVVADNKLCCLDRASGREVWKSDKKIKGRPFLAELADYDDHVIYACIDGKMTAIDFEHGEQIWRCDKKEIDYLGDIVLRGNFLLAIDPGGYDEDKGEHTGKYRVVCHDLSSGEMLWKYDDAENFRDWNMYNDTLLQVMDKDRIRIFNLNIRKKIGEIKVKDYYNFYPLEAQFIDAGEKGVICYGFDGKTKIWEVKARLSKRDYSEFIEDLNLVVFPTRDEGVLGISTADGSVVWKTIEIKDPVLYYRPSYEYFLALDKKTLHRFDLQ